MSPYGLAVRCKNPRTPLRTAFAFVMLVGLALLAGCHSALFQTAKTPDGIDFTMGVTRMSTQVDPDISDYSVLVKGEYGRRAGSRRVGYGLALTFIAPFRNRERDSYTDIDSETKIFPNEWAGLMPELKLQIPRLIPVDVAIDFRFLGVMPERAALITSYDVNPSTTLYGAYAYSSGIPNLVTLGASLDLNSRVTALVEYSGWLSAHDYPEGSSGPRHPYSLGLAVCFRIPRSREPHDPTQFASTP